jgi:phosphoserine phosphatase RsbU/P
MTTSVPSDRLWSTGAPLWVTDDQLGAIRSVVDAYLGNLGVDDILGEITRRLTQLLGVDTAAVLLRDGDSDYLVARAAYGLEEEVHQGVRVPIGTGFAGTIAERGGPAVLDRVDESTVVNPLLWERGIKAMVGVPLVDGQTVVGVLHVGSLEPRNFTTEDVRSLQLVAEWVADALRNRGSEVERVTAQVLQRSLLPSRVPRCPGMRFATRYVPAEEGGVGGDWYDAFSLPTGELWLMVGDVAGHGLMPAIIMGRLRSSLRSYLLAGHGAEEVLELADRKLQFFERGAMATVLLVSLEPPYDRVRLTSAGHLPPVLASPGEATTVVDVPVSAPLGVGGGRPPTSVTIDFPWGATMIAYTDGLIERRHESLDAGIERLVAAVRADDPEVVCRDVMDALVGRETPRDDIAVVAVHRDPEEQTSASG